ncbi:MAG: fibronectin type III domain-containing protein [Actinomycetota bacterium]
MMSLASYRTPLALLVASSVVTGAALVANDASNTALSTSPAGTWLPNDAADSVTRVGPAGSDTTIALLEPIGRLDVLTIDGQVYVTDESGQVSRLDLARLDVADEQDLPDDVELVGGGSRVYAVDPSAETVQELDALTLLPVGSTVHVGGTVGDAVVDDEGVLWIVDLDTGAVLAIDGDRIVERLPVGDPGADLDLTVTPVGAVVVDRTDPTVIVPDGREVEIELSDDGRVASPDDTNGSPVVPVLQGSILLLIDVTDGTVRRVALGVDGHDLGVPQVTSTRVIVPDHTNGSLHLVDLRAAEVVAEIQLPDAPTSFDVVVDGDVAYVNDRDSERVWMIEPDGALVERRKYDPDGEGTTRGQPAGDGTDPGSDPAADESEPEEPDEPATGDDAIVVPRPPPSRPDAPPPTAPDPLDGGGDDPGSASGEPPATTNPGSPSDSPTTTVGGETNPPDQTAPTAPTTPTTVPGAVGVSDLLVVAANRGATISWEVPAAWADLDAIIVEVIDAAGAVVQSATLPADARRHVVDDLVNGAPYRIAITMRRGDDESERLVSGEVVPGVAGDGLPATVVATAGDGEISVGWSEPTDWYDVTGYRVDVIVDDGSSATTPVATRTLGRDETATTFTGLDNGVVHVVDVTPTSDDGDGRTGRSNPVTPTGVRVAGDGTVVIESISADDATATITWQPPVDWYDVTSYRLVAVAGDGTTVAVPDAAATATSATATGLRNGTTYRIRITAVSAQGLGPVGESAPVTPIGDGSVRRLRAAPGDGSATITWEPPIGWRPVTGYRLTVSPGGSIDVASSARRHDLTGLANGATHQVTVRALSASGTGAPSTVGPFTPAANLPSAPTITSTTAGDGSITMGWSEPTSGQWSDYVVTATPTGGGTPASSTIAGTRTSYEFRGLTNGRAYDLSVTAVHPGGTPGGADTATGVVPVGLPTRPVVGTAVSDASGTAVTLTWSAPGNDGGSPLTGYVLDGSVVGGSAVVSGLTLSASSTTHTVTGLTTGTTYRFTIVARNGVGQGPTGTFADVRTNVPLPDPPSAPRGFEARPGNGHVELVWIAPATNPGDVTQYAIEMGGEERRLPVSQERYVWTGLTNGTSYTFTIRAIAPAGPSLAATDTATPSGAPAAPSGLTGGPVTQTSVSVSWSQTSPTNGTTVSSWIVTVGGSSSTITSSPHTIGGLSPSTDYTVSVVAVGANGINSSAASVSVRTADPPPPVPGPVTGLTAYLEWEFMDISWNAVANATSYEYSLDGGSWQTTTSTSVFINNWTRNSGQVRVRAVNASGAGSIAQAGYSDICPYPDPC